MSWRKRSASMPPFCAARSRAGMRSAIRAAMPISAAHAARWCGSTRHRSCSARSIRPCRTPRAGRCTTRGSRSWTFPAAPLPGCTRRASSAARMAICICRAAISPNASSPAGLPAARLPGKCPGPERNAEGGGCHCRSRLTTHDEASMTRSWYRVAAALIIGVLLQPGADAWAQDAAAFYRGKVVRLIVGYAPGGGYDSYARLVAPYLESRLGATVIVENQPGGGGFNALANLVREPGDGSRILLLNGEAALLSTLVNDGSRRFDLRNLAYLGRVSYENRVLVARAGTPYARFDGFLKSGKPVFFGAGGRIDSMGDPASLLCDAL